MKKLLLVSVLALVACADENVPADTNQVQAGSPAVAVTEEAFSFSCQTLADNAARQFLQYAANASSDEMHWYPAPDNFEQVGGAAYHQTVRARAYFLPSPSGTRIANLCFCDTGSCPYYATYKCDCGGFNSCVFQ